MEDITQRKKTTKTNIMEKFKDENQKIIALTMTVFGILATLIFIL